MSEYIGVIGLGAMGLAMAERLAQTNAVRGFDVAPERCDQAQLHGVEVCPSPASAAEGCGVVVIAVRDQAQLQSALFGPAGVAGGIAPRACVILTSTVGPSHAVAAAQKLANQDVDFVDAPVSGGSVRAARGDLLLMVAGSPRALAKADHVLERLGTTRPVVGQLPGDGQTLKVVNQLLCGVHTAAAAEAVALAHALGLDLPSVIDILGTGAAASFMLADRGPRMARALSGPVEVRSRVDVIDKDMRIVLDLVAAHGLSTPVARAAGQMYQNAMRAGLATLDDSSCVLLPALIPSTSQTPTDHRNATKEP